ncbi:TadE/TadG family type IV pilus assembly protein [Benzoatithermus flavus]|uniref:TadE/TadG family type IV pilus assembly protein n=1 Tax=Benzoatithermus flavus TaxID=3108223 RepID=A0ABU8XNJ4_9PROT
MRKHLRSFARDPAGNAIVEFALVMPLLLLLIVGSFELAIMLLVGGSLEAAVLAASRYGATGYEGGGVSREARIRQIIGERTFGLVDLDRATIETLVYPSFSDIGHPEPFTDANGNGRYDAGEPFVDTNGNGQWDRDMGRPGTGGACDVVLYVVTYDTGPITGLLQPIMGRITHRASVAVRNEPYGGTPC